MLLLPSSLSSLSLAFQAVLLSAADAHGATQKNKEEIHCASRSRRLFCGCSPTASRLRALRVDFRKDMWPAIMQTAVKRGSRESPGWMLCFQLWSLEPGPVANKNVSSCRLAPRPDQMVCYRELPGARGVCVPAWSLATCLSISRLFFSSLFLQSVLVRWNVSVRVCKSGTASPLQRPKRSVCHDVASFRWETWDSR
ncbi:hypothetical protein HDV57DRAFT_60227 [Trichoderma longibrachiatum]